MKKGFIGIWCLALLAVANLVWGAPNYHPSPYIEPRVRGAITSGATGLSYDLNTGIFSLTTGYAIPTTTQIGNWNSAFGWGNHAGLYLPVHGKADTSGNADTVTNGVYTTGAGTIYRPIPSIQYLLDGPTFTPVCPAAGADCRWKLGVDTNGTTYSGITQAVSVAAPITGTPVDGQQFKMWIYDNGTAHNVTFNAAFTPVGVSMASNIIASNGTINKAVVITGNYNLAAGKWQVLGISYE